MHDGHIGIGCSAPSAAAWHRGGVHCTRQSRHGDAEHRRCEGIHRNAPHGRMGMSRRMQCTHVYLPTYGLCSNVATARYIYAYQYGLASVRRPFCMCTCMCACAHVAFSAHMVDLAGPAICRHCLVHLVHDEHAPVANVEGQLVLTQVRPGGEAGRLHACMHACVAWMRRVCIAKVTEGCGCLWVYMHRSSMEVGSVRWGPWCPCA